jgi:hypothetical protein
MAIRSPSTVSRVTTSALQSDYACYGLNPPPGTFSRVSLESVYSRDRADFPDSLRRSSIALDVTENMRRRAMIHIMNHSLRNRVTEGRS